MRYVPKKQRKASWDFSREMRALKYLRSLEGRYGKRKSSGLLKRTPSGACGHYFVDLYVRAGLFVTWEILASQKLANQGGSLAISWIIHFILPVFFFLQFFSFLRKPKSLHITLLRALFYFHPPTFISRFIYSPRA